MAKIIIEQDKCIGCGSCVSICPKFFELKDDAKSSLIGGQKDEKGNYVLETEKIECAESAAEACPAQCIIIEK